MTPQVQVLEELTRVTPFGVRFWDVSTTQAAEPGLSVIIYPPAMPELRSTADVTRKGVYFFHDLPGMRQIEYGSGDDAFWAATPPQIPFTVEVSDPMGRYLPYRFSVLLPVHGTFGIVDSPLSPILTPDATWLPVFAAPARELGGPIGTVRAVLQDDTAGAPAAWALVTAQIPGSPLMIGLADDRGVLSMMLPYPEPRNSPFASPLGPGSTKLSDQTWPIAISVFYSPGAAGQSIRDLGDILQQGAATAWQDTARSAPAGNYTLQYAKELVLRSLDSASGRELPVLLITPAQSPL
ncbi:MAG TPA: hypothetical protein VKU19_37235 [Bryobacteraceae bacterium]|nr:hypothetical protein [Bryobacteraceae bacterium]